MKFLNWLRNAASLALRADETIAALRIMRNQAVLSTSEHLALTAAGLLKTSQHSPDGGYAISFSLLLGWQRGYIETTGYIIPTVLDLATTLDRLDLRTNALAQGEWLLRHQMENGAFPDIERNAPAVFDTGQVLIGLQRLHSETQDRRYLVAAERAAQWLHGEFLDSCQRDGLEARRFPTYVTRSASALIDFGVTYGHQDYIDSGREFLEWAAQQILPSGLFKHSQLGGDSKYLLHTIVYVLEGFLHAYRVLGDLKYLDAAKSGAEGLKRVNLNRDITLYTFYNADLTSLTREKCLTGLSQWAGVCLTLFELTGDDSYRECASNTLFYVKSKQIQTVGQLQGGLPGSVPIWGKYLGFSFPGWNLKFFADALLHWKALGLGDGRQQEEFVARSHAIHADAVGWTAQAEAVDELDIDVLDYIERVFSASATSQHQRPAFLDLGCGEGRFLTLLQQRRPDWVVEGVDPQPPRNSQLAISHGTAVSIPRPDGSLDGVYATIALQHVDDIEASLAEVLRVLRPGGAFVVFDRNPISLRGFLKPWHEIRGRWLYSWDSPFRERWYTLGRWKALFRRAGFQRVNGRAITHASGAGLRGKLPVNRFVLVAGHKA